MSRSIPWGCYNDGYVARHEGDPLDSCPCRPRRSLYACIWRSGWHTADQRLDSVTRIMSDADAALLASAGDAGAERDGGDHVA